ncbi:hypothetical protein AMATHDRAFT_67200 [Amanita thiersii Skay4041]|uniref:DUF6534 domain-containing protein n=1 Tax=Amanita thiersii Skay4041 TaxID=703135 RepID=A0A2A9NHH0_9AGAR|nr:hypothetical protein AMATHDRAFT_67200 [Amanita thiersii Skay4041]
MIYSVIRFAISTYVGIAAFLAKNIPEFQRRNIVSVTFSLCVSAAIDVTIAICMTIHLLQLRQRADTRTVVVRIMDKLVMWTIRTGLITSIASVLELVTFQVYPNTSIVNSLLFWRYVALPFSDSDMDFYPCLSRQIVLQLSSLSTECKAQPT